MNDDIEILDIFDEKKKEKPKEEITPKKIDDNNKSVSPRKKKRKIKTKALQLVFCSLSALFIIGCIVFYGTRFVKYYRIYNPKIETDSAEILLGNYIYLVGEESIVYEGNGLYNVNASYVYKGDVETNYLLYNNMLWRILKIDSLGNIEIILDDYVSLLPWNKEITNFSKTELYSYLNNEFLSYLDKEMLVNTNSFCDSLIEKLNDKCEKQNIDSYVKLLDVKDFLNTVVDKKSYLVSDDELFWLSNYSTEKVWHTNGVNASSSDSSVFYEIRPVVKLKSNIIYTSGDGTKDNPYVVGENKLSVGSIVMLDEDKWIVYDIKSDVKLMRYDVLKDKQIFDRKKYNYDESQLKEYLNTTYLDSLSYKDKIVNSDYYVGEYVDSINDIKKDKINVKVAIPNILDLKFDSSISGYFTLTKNDEVMWAYENPLIPSRITTQRSIRPCIAITKEYANSLQYVNGVYKEVQ